MREDEQESPPAEQLYEYEEPSLIDLEDLEGVSGGQTLICITGGSAEIWPKSDWNDY